MASFTSLEASAFFNKSSTFFIFNLSILPKITLPDLFTVGFPDNIASFKFFNKAFLSLAINLLVTVLYAGKIASIFLSKDKEISFAKLTSADLLPICVLSKLKNS